MRQTSIDAYNKIKNEGLLSELRFEVYSVIFKNGPITQGEAAKHFMHGDRNVVSPRFAELNRRGVICCVGSRPCKVTGINCMIWDSTGKLPVEPEKKKSVHQK